MHELSIALSIVEAAEEEVQRQGGGEVCTVHLRLGPLSGVVREALQFSWELACAGTPLERSELTIENVPVRIYCGTCAAEGDPVSAQCLYCARCGGTSCRVTAGAELEVVSLELVEFAESAT